MAHVPGRYLLSNGHIVVKSCALALIGALLVAIRQVLVSKRLGVSQTAIEIINGRWTMHIFGIRSDEATARLAAALPNTSVFGLWLCLHWQRRA